MILPSRRIVPAAHRRMAWKNGQGTTAEIATGPEREGRFAWRLSLADVAASGPFSDFTGYDRWIMLVRGVGMRLEFGGAAPAVTVDRPFQPVRFDGASATSCRLLGGPIVDFNLMVDRAQLSAEVAVQRRGKREFDLVAGAWLLLHEFTGRARLYGTGIDTIIAASESVVLGPAPARLHLWIEGDATTTSFAARLDPLHASIAGELPAPRR